MKKANQKEHEPAKVEVAEGQLKPLLHLLKFPIDHQEREAFYIVEREEQQAAMFRQQMESNRRRMENAQKRADQYRKDLGEKVPLSTQDARKVLEEIGKLAWVERVSVSAHSVVVTTRRDMLKTRLTQRFVYDGGHHEREFLKEPVIVSLPKYEIVFDLRAFSDHGSDGMHLANQRDRLAIRLIDPKDVSDFKGLDAGFRHEPHAHWASNASPGLGSWQGCCLGEYEEDLEEAAEEGVVPFLTTFSLYLQMSGDDHAFRGKTEWAMMMGNPDYNEHILRKKNEDETWEQIVEQYKKDYKIAEQPEIPPNAQVNPGEGRPPMPNEDDDIFEAPFGVGPMFVDGAHGGDGVAAAAIAGGAGAGGVINPAHLEAIRRRLMQDDTVVPNGSIGIGTILPTNDSEDDTDDECDCSEPGEGNGDECDCGGLCNCHDEV